MANIMASGRGAACALAGLLLQGGFAATAADQPNVSEYSPLPTPYSLSYERDGWGEDYSVFHLAVVDDFGVMGSGFAASDDPRLKPLTRLDSAWNVNTRFSPYPLRLGDGVSSTSLWDQPVRMGGIQIGSYQPALPGVVAPPSVVMMPYGTVGPVMLTTSRFIDHLHTLIELQQQSLAAPGQADFSVESGPLRQNFELRSDDYGPWLTSGTYRYGLGSLTTVDGQVAQVAHAQSYVGLGVLQGLGAASLSAGVASSHDAETSGWLARLGADFTRDRFSLALRTNIQSPGYLPVGDVAYLEALRQRTLASAGVDLGRLGWVSLASATQIYLDDTRRDIVALSHSMWFGSGGIVSAAAAYSTGPFGASALLLSFTYPFDYLGATDRLDRAVSSALDRTIGSAFGQTRLTPYLRLPVDRYGMSSEP